MNKYNRKVFDTRHAIDRFIERYQNKVDRKTIDRIIDDSINKIIEAFKDEPTTYASWSKSTGVCVIIDWRKDIKNKRDVNNHAVIVTFLPIKQKFTDVHLKNESDVRIIVESLLQSTVKLTESYSNYIQEVTIGDLHLFFENGILFDSGISFCFGVK